LNILFIGPYRQSDGWGLAAKHYLRSLNMIYGHNVSAAPIYMSNNIERNITGELLELENRRYDKYDVIIQKTLPNYFQKNEQYTIGIYTSETKSLSKSLFIEYINILDELWVMSMAEKATLQNDGVTVPITVIPGPVDIDVLEYHENVKKLDIPGIENKFVFYILGEYVDRKNIMAAVIAFNREFVIENDVILLIKTNVPGQDHLQSQQKVTNDILEVKKALRLFNHQRLYNNEILITQHLGMAELMSLHKTGDCLLVPSRGEAYCRPAIEASYFGNSIICTEGIHTVDILDSQCVTVNSMEMPILTYLPPAQHIYTGWETWNEIDVLDLQRKMRAAYHNNEEIKIKNGKSWVKNKFSYESISQQIQDRLEHVDYQQSNT